MLILKSFGRALGQLDDPAFRRVVLVGIGLAALVLAVLAFLLILAVGAVAETGIAWLDATLGIFGGLAGVILAILLFPAAAGLVVGFLLDDIADAVEARYYPRLAPVRDQGYIKPVLMATRFLFVIVAANILALILVYAIPGVNLIVFFMVNGYLIGREFFDLVAVRRVAADDIPALRRRHGLVIFVTGCVITLLFSVPIINILAPVIGAATMVHIFQMLCDRD